MRSGLDARTHRLALATTVTVSVALDVFRLARDPAVPPSWAPWTSVALAALVVLVPAWSLVRVGRAWSLAAGGLGLATWHVVWTLSGSAGGGGGAASEAGAGPALLAAGIAAAPILLLELVARRRAFSTPLVPALPVVTVLAWLACGELTARVAARPKPEASPPASLLDGFEIESLTLRTADGVRLDAWLVVRDPDRCVLLLAGIGGNRRMLVPRARFWLSRGWSVLMPDLRGTGSSDPVPITFGARERLDVAACWRALVDRGFGSIAVHAQSLGAAAFCYARRDRRVPEPTFAVLEAVYDDVRQALYRRLPWIPFPDAVLWPVVGAATYGLGEGATELRPIDAIASLHAPLLLVQGTDDEKVGVEVPRAILAACPAPVEDIAWIDGLGHVDLWREAPDASRAAIEAFLTRLR